MLMYCVFSSLISSQNSASSISTSPAPQEPQLLYVSFIVSSPSGGAAEAANFLLLQVMSYRCPIMLGAAGGFEPSAI